MPSRSLAGLFTLLLLAGLAFLLYSGKKSSAPPVYHATTRFWIQQTDSGDPLLEGSDPANRAAWVEKEVKSLTSDPVLKRVAESCELMSKWNLPEPAVLAQLKASVEIARENEPAIVGVTVRSLGSEEAAIELADAVRDAYRETRRMAEWEWKQWSLRNFETMLQRQKPVVDEAKEELLGVIRRYGILEHSEFTSSLLHPEATPGEWIEATIPAEEPDGLDKAKVIYLKAKKDYSERCRQADDLRMRIATLAAEPCHPRSPVDVLEKAAPRPVD